MVKLSRLCAERFEVDTLQKKMIPTASFVFERARGCTGAPGVHRFAVTGGNIDIAWKVGWFVLLPEN